MNNPRKQPHWLNRFQMTEYKESGNKEHTSLKEDTFGAAINTTNGANSAVRRTFSACKKKISILQAHDTLIHT